MQRSLFVESLEPRTHLSVVAGASFGASAGAWGFAYCSASTAFAAAASVAAAAVATTSVGAAGYSPAQVAQGVWV